MPTWRRRLAQTHSVTNQERLLIAQMETTAVYKVYSKASQLLSNSNHSVRTLLGLRTWPQVLQNSHNRNNEKKSKGYCHWIL